RPEVCIGSKAHPDSDVSTSLLRRVMSSGFRLLRRMVLHLPTADPQGTIFISTGLARRVAPHLRCQGFLIGTEIVCWARRLGVTEHEVPVVYRATGSSTVSPLRDSWRVLTGTFELRRRLRAMDATVPAPQTV